MICVSLGNIPFEEALDLCSKVRMVEIRADLLKWPDEQYKAIIGSGVKTVFTCRPVQDGPDRKDLFRSAAKWGADYIDLEYESDNDLISFVQRIKNDAAIIISYHNYKETPSAELLRGIMNKSFERGADVVKIACRADSSAEIARLLSLYEYEGRKVILGMGKNAKITRVAALYLGSEFTFASAGTGAETAEGQISYKTMQEISRLINNNL